MLAADCGLGYCCAEFGVVGEPMRGECAADVLLTGFGP